MDRQTNTDRGVAREKSCAVLNFARLDSLRRSYVLSLAHGKNFARSRSSRFSLATARSRSRSRLQV